MIYLLLSTILAYMVVCKYNLVVFILLMSTMWGAMKNSDKVAIVTGAGRGIGAATAKLLATKGYAVVINYRQQHQRAKQVAAEIRAGGGTCLTVKADISNEDEVHRLFDIVDNELGSVTALVNNAGILFPQSDFMGITSERWYKTFQVNVAGTMLCCQQAIKRMATRYGGHGGNIVNVSSVASRTGSPNEYVDYAASKGAVDSLTKGLAMEYAADGVRVNAVRPGMIDTEIHADGGEKGRVARLAPDLPMQRGGQPQEVADAIYWLISDRSSFTTGSMLDIAGGL